MAADHVGRGAEPPSSLESTAGGKASKSDRQAAKSEGRSERQAAKEAKRQTIAPEPGTYYGSVTFTAPVGGVQGQTGRDLFATIDLQAHLGGTVNSRQSGQPIADLSGKVSPKGAFKAKDTDHFNADKPARTACANGRAGHGRPSRSPSCP